MSALSTLGWWFDHLPRCLISDLTVTGQKLREELEALPATPESVQKLATELNCFDRWLETESVPQEGSDLLNACTSYVMEEPSGKRVQAVRTMLGGLKKWRKPLPDQPDMSLVLKGEAVQGFMQRCTKSYPPIPWYIAEIMRGLLKEVFAPFDAALSRTMPAIGPGAVREGFPTLLKWAHLNDDPAFDPYALRMRLAGQPSCVEPVWSRLSAVDKDIWKKRLITVEPNVSVFIQQWVRRSMLFCMKLHPLTRHMVLKSRKSFDGSSSLRDLLPPHDPMSVFAKSFRKEDDAQDIHKELAREGSLGTEGKDWCTLDFSDASDHIGLDQVASVFPADVLAWLEFGRSTHVRLSSKSPSIPVNVFAGMGNATTFVVETLMFWSLCEAFLRWAHLRRHRVYVFGDDVILRGNVARHPLFDRLLTQVGWQLNEAKSFKNELGRFRESCGIQAWKGQDVTLIRFYGYDPKDGRDRAALADKLKQLCRHGFYELADAIFEAQESVPNVEGAPDGSACVDFPWQPYSLPKYRWRADLQRLEIRVPTLAPRRYRTTRSTGLIWGSLLGYSYLEKLSRKRRRPCFSASVPHQSIIIDKWLPAT